MERLLLPPDVAELRALLVAAIGRRSEALDGGGSGGDDGGGSAASAVAATPAAVTSAASASTGAETASAAGNPVVPPAITTTTPVLLRGRVRQRRRHGKALAFLDVQIVDGGFNDAACECADDGIVQVMLARGTLQLEVPEAADEHGAPSSSSSSLPSAPPSPSPSWWPFGGPFLPCVQALNPGSVVEVVGLGRMDKAHKRLTIVASRLRLVRCRAYPTSVSRVVAAVFHGALSAAHAASLLDVSQQRVERVVALYGAVAATGRADDLLCGDDDKGGEGGEAAMLALDAADRAAAARSDATASMWGAGAGSGDGGVPSTGASDGDRHRERESDARAHTDVARDAGEHESEHGAVVGTHAAGLTPAGLLKAEVVKLARRLAGMPELPPSRPRLLRDVPADVIATVRAVEARAAASGVLLTPETDAAMDDAAAADADAMGAAHPVHNVPPASLLPGDGPSSSFADRVRYLQQRKAPQVAWIVAMLRAIGGVSDDSHGDGSGGAGAGVGDVGVDTSFRAIVDVGAGRCDLALALAASLPHASVTVVDRNASALTAGRERAASLLSPSQLARVRFTQLDARELSTAALHGTDAASLALAGTDLFVGLHACGALTDTILELAVRCRASFLVVPCCFCTGPAGAAACDSGGVSDAQRRVLCSVAESADAGEEMHDLAFRCMTLVNSYRLRRADASGCFSSVQLRSFRRSFSSRNQVLIGVAKK